MNFSEEILSHEKTEDMGKAISEVIINKFENICSLKFQDRTKERI